ncbi:MAG: tRNA lysidine(34) synthetase TilS [Caldimonas sp.]|uniref:tRNA lysidine(34) synthetase TilS n=1 Tax=Caldimonas sp. TaxID=2838790 RepID=UPI00391900B1
METAAAAPGVVAVAYSGGRDSTALLFATLQVARPLGWRVVALHVHHGLHPRADEWLAHCRRQCEAWRRCGWPVSLVWEHLGLHPAPGQSVEAVARRARYQALRRMAMGQGATVVLLGHHRTDQAETFVLQALRGAGVAGLAGMPAAAHREGLVWLRPWLGRPRSEIEAYVRRHRLRYVDDDSNADERYARNRLRARVWPALLEAFPQAEAALADAAAWAQEAATCLDELAAIDLSSLDHGQGLDLRACLRLPPARARNALRAWIRQASGQRPSMPLLERLWHEGPHRATARWDWAGGELRLYRGTLRWCPHSGQPAGAREGVREARLSLRGAGAIALPGWGGRLHVEAVDHGGVPWSRLRRLELRARSGGEQFQAGPGRPPRSLKKQFQSAGVAVWAREGPLVYDVQGHLLFVPGLGMDARTWAEPGRRQWRLRWEPTA